MVCELKYFPQKDFYNRWGLKVQMVKVPKFQILPYLQRTRLWRQRAKAKHQSAQNADSAHTPYFTVKLSPEDFSFVNEKRQSEQNGGGDAASPAKKGTVTLDTTEGVAAPEVPVSTKDEKAHSK